MAGFRPPHTLHRESNMPEKALHNIRIAAIMTDGFEQIEFTSPKDALHNEGAIVHILAPSDRTEPHLVQGWHHLNRGDHFDVDSNVDEASPDDYHAVLLPGGVINADRLRMDEATHDFLRQLNDDSKPIFVICHAPWTLISAGLVRGRRMTSYHSLKDDMINAGAQWTDEPVVVDENLVSSRNPGDLEQFNRAAIEMLTRVATGHGQKAAHTGME
jgi:protease I